MSDVCPVYLHHPTCPDPVGTSHLGQNQTSDRHQSDAYALPSTKSGLFQPFEHMIPRLLRAELSGEGPGVKEWP